MQFPAGSFSAQFSLIAVVFSLALFSRYWVSEGSHWRAGDISSPPGARRFFASLGLVPGWPRRHQTPPTMSRLRLFPSRRFWCVGALWLAIVVSVLHAITVRSRDGLVGGAPSLPQHKFLMKILT